MRAARGHGLRRPSASGQQGAAERRGGLVLLQQRQHPLLCGRVTGQHEGLQTAVGTERHGTVLAALDIDIAQRANGGQRQGLFHGAQQFGRALLAAGARPPQAMAPRSPQVCACHDVSVAAIAAALPDCTGDSASRLRELQSRLKCGTECGSCLPAVKALLRRQASVEQLA